MGLDIKQELAAMTHCQAILLSLFLAGCSTPRVQVQSAPNACTIEAIQMAEGLRKHGIRSSVLSMWWLDQVLGHTVTVYLYPIGANKLWVWDKITGSTNINAYIDNAPQIAREWSRLYHKSGAVTDAIFED